MEKIIGIEKLKDEFRKAKLQYGDLRGLKNRFKLADRLNINQLQVYFFAASSNNERIEVVAEISHREEDCGFDVYTMKELVEEVKKETTPLYITIEVLTWNKWRTDADRKHLPTFMYENN